MAKRKRSGALDQTETPAASAIGLQAMFSQEDGPDIHQERILSFQKQVLTSELSPNALAERTLVTALPTLELVLELRKYVMSQLWRQRDGGQLILDRVRRLSTSDPLQSDIAILRAVVRTFELEARELMSRVEWKHAWVEWRPRDLCLQNPLGQNPSDQYPTFAQNQETIREAKKIATSSAIAGAIGMHRKANPSDSKAETPATAAGSYLAPQEPMRPKVRANPSHLVLVELMHSMADEPPVDWDTDACLPPPCIVSFAPPSSSSS